MSHIKRITASGRLKTWFRKEDVVMSVWNFISSKSSSFQLNIRLTFSKHFKFSLKHCQDEDLYLTNNTKKFLTATKKTSFLSHSLSQFHTMSWKMYNTVIYLNIKKNKPLKLLILFEVRIIFCLRNGIRRRQRQNRDKL